MEVGNWQAVARDQEVLFKNVKADPKPYSPESLPPPTTKLAKSVEEFAKSHLDPKAFNHSNRIFYFGLGIIKDTFPDYVIDEETWYCTCLLHDIGLAEKFHLTTKMSFEVCPDLLTVNRRLTDSSKVVLSLGSFCWKTEPRRNRRIQYASQSSCTRISGSRAGISRSMAK